MRRDATPIATLTALRFPAALLVFACHFSNLFADPHYHCMGIMGVDFFYILSGFILSYRYHETFGRAITKLDLKRFYRARFARIYPIHLTTLAIWLVLFQREYLSVTSASHIRVLVENLALIESWLYIPIAPESLNSVAWSISNEAFFYALFPFLLFAIIARSQHFSRSVLLKIAVGVWFIQFLISQIPQATLDIFLFYYFPPARLADFVIGMLVGLYFLRLPAATPVLNKWSATIRETIMFTALPVFSAALWMVPLRYQFSLVITPFLAVLIYTFARQLGEISTILSSRIPVYLGEASFAFYMVHLTVLNYFSFIDGHPASYLTRTLIATISLAISIVLSILLHERIEKPARRAILAYASHKERVVSTRAAAGERSTI